MSNLTHVRKCPKGACKAKLDNIRSKGHLLTNYGEKPVMFGSPQFGPQKCLKL